MTVFLIVAACILLLVVLMLLAEYVDDKKTKENDRLDIERFVREMIGAVDPAKPVEDSTAHAEVVEVVEVKAETPVEAPAKKVAKKAAKKTVKAEGAVPAAKSKRTYKKKSPKA